jgi:riboflavin-specific deaminase-like protein
MAAHELTAEDAWCALCSARRCLSAGVADEPVAGIAFMADGSWRAPGAVSAEACDLLDCLGPLVAQPGRLVIGQLGQSLDGRIATQNGHSHYINDLASRVHLHRLRALVDAVVIGAGAAVADDPRLTVRHVDGPQPVRVILDPQARVPANSHLLCDGAAPTLQVVGDHISLPAPASGHVQRLRLPCDADAGFAPAMVLDAMAERGLSRVLIEGGGITLSRFLDAGVLDRLHLLVAPLLIGPGRPGLSTVAIDSLDDAWRPRARRFNLGPDTLFDLILDGSRRIAERA